MKKGHITTIVGFALFLFGVGIIPFRIVGEPFGIQFQAPHLWEHEILEDGILGIQGWMLQVATVFAALAGIGAVLGLLTRHKRRLGLTNLVFGLAVLFLGVWAISSPTRALGLPEEEAKNLVGAFWENLLVMGGAGLIALGALGVLAARARWKTGERFLRVAMLWDGAVIKERILFEENEATIGEDRKSTFMWPAAKRAEMPERLQVFRKVQDGIYKILLNSRMQGRLKLAGRTCTIAQYLQEQGSAEAEVQLEAGDWGLITVSDLSLYFQAIQASSALDLPPVALMSERLDLSILSTTLLSVVLQIGLILSSIFLWEEKIDIEKRNEVRKLLKVEFATKEEKKEEEMIDTGQEDDTTGKKAEGEEGKFGDPDVDPEIESKIPKRDGQMVAKIDPKKVGLNDILSTSKMMGKGAISNILSANSSGFANKLAVAMSGTGVEFVMGHGAGGLGFKGTGTGGGGTGGYGRIHGLGQIDTGGGVGVKGFLGRKKERRVGKIDFGGGSSQGFCEKEDITRVVRMRAGAIRACYEEQLQIKPDLKGKVTCRWTIALDGQVNTASITQSTLGNSAVENCILRAIRRMRFKKPEGGLCIVQWPFVFNPS